MIGMKATKKTESNENGLKIGIFLISELDLSDIQVN